MHTAPCVCPICDPSYGVIGTTKHSTAYCSVAAMRVVDRRHGARGTGANEMMQTIQVANPDATSYVVGNLSAGTYYFAISAYTTMGTQSAESAVGSKTTL